MTTTEFIQHSSVIASTVTSLNAKIGSILKKSFEQQQQGVKANYDKYLQLQQQFFLAEETANNSRNNRRKTEMQTFFNGMGAALSSTMKQQERQLLSLSTTSEKIVSSLGTALISTMGTVLTEGKSFVESTGKVIVGTALQALDSLVPVIVAQITGVQLASPNPANALSFGAAGLASAVALTATFKGLVALAKSAAGFKDGGLVRGGEQFIRINEMGQEFVMNARTTKAFLPELNQLNAGKIPQTFATNAAQPSQQLFQRIDQLLNKLQSKTTTVHNTISVNGTLRANGSDLQTILDKQIRRKVALS